MGTREGLVLPSRYPRKFEERTALIYSSPISSLERDLAYLIIDRSFDLLSSVADQASKDD